MKAPAAPPLYSQGPPRTPPPPPPPPPRNSGWWDVPFRSPRNLLLTVASGTVAYWMMVHGSTLQLSQSPDIPFHLAGYAGVAEEDFMYYKTPGGNWVAAAVDERQRMYFIDQQGDLFYDSGDPQIGLYAMDTTGNLYNFYSDISGKRKITPVGNIAGLKSFKISEIAGVKLARDVNVVAFEDGSSVELPIEGLARDQQGQAVLPPELVEGFDMSPNGANPKLEDGAMRTLPRTPIELDLNDQRSLEVQLFSQSLLDDPDIPGLQPALPDDFDFETFRRDPDKYIREFEAREGPE